MLSDTHEKELEMNKNNIHVLARAVIMDQRHMLLAYDPRPHPNHYYEVNTHFYYLPSGHIEFHESSSNALLREIEEETGYAGTIERFLGIVEHAWNVAGSENYCHTHEVNLIFKVQIPDLTWGDNIPQREDHVAFKWIPLDQLKDTDLRPSLLKETLSQWLETSNDSVLQSTFK